MLVVVPKNCRHESVETAKSTTNFTTKNLQTEVAITVIGTTSMS